MVRKVKDRIRARFHVSICEVGGQDTWQRIGLGFALVSTDRRKVESLVGEMVAAIEAMGLAEVVGDERDIMSYGGEPMALPGRPMRGMDKAMQEMPGAMAGTDTGQDTVTGAADEDWIPDAWRSEDEEPKTS